MITAIIPLDKEQDLRKYLDRDHFQRIIQSTSQTTFRINATTRVYLENFNYYIVQRA